jgi:hypothetical protein
MTSSEQDVIIDLPPSHLEEDAGDELNAAQLGESSKNEKSSGKRSKVEDSTTTEARHLLELESQTESELGPKEKKRMKRAFKKKSKMEDSNNTKISELRSETKEFLHTIHKYLDCREKMDAKYLEVDELQTIAKFQLTTDSGGIETDSDDKFEYKTEYQQQSIKAEPVKTLQELYAAAEISKPIYQDTITRIVDQVCEAFGDQKDAVEVDFAPLKGRDRAQAKADDDYSKRNPGPCISWLFDIVRGSIKFSTCEQVAKCVELIQEDPSTHIVKAKNRFATPTLTGYRDLNLCIQIDTHKASSTSVRSRYIMEPSSLWIRSSSLTSIMSTSARISQELVRIV